MCEQEQYETIADTGRVLKLESDNLEALELRGRRLPSHSNHHINTYIHTYIKIMILLEGHSSYLNMLTGRAYYILGELDTAMNHYRKGLKFDPEHKGIKDMYRIIKKVQDYQKKAKKYSSSVCV